MATVIRSETHPDIGAYEDVNRDVLRLLSRPGRSYLVLLSVTIALVITMFTAWGIQIVLGIGMSGLRNPIGWGVYITTFVFWVGIGHAGTLISAVLYLFRARWRQSIYRAAEAMTVFAVMTAGLFPVIHVGRPWLAYYLIPYPNQRMIWPNFRSPLVWDVFAVGTYFTVSATFFFIGMIPDLAAARDSAIVPWRRRLYSILSLGWRGTNWEWKNFTRAYLYLAALATPLVLSVHSVVSWDFAMSLVPGWHSTVFAPYFVAGAIFSGLAMVLTLMIPVRKIYGLEAYITPRHTEAMAKMMLLTAMIVSYAYACEAFVGWYTFEAAEQHGGYLLFGATGEYWWSTWLMLTCNFFVPQLLWFRSVRRNFAAMFVITLFVNIGMWFERYSIIVVSLSHEYEPWMWNQYRPSLTGMLIILGSFGWFLMWFLLFLRLLPAVSVAELKEVLPAPLRLYRRPRPAAETTPRPPVRGRGTEEGR
jgi:molybdopterin-containing oxidoreductase family membrane subunit